MPDHRGHQQQGGQTRCLKRYRAPYHRRQFHPIRGRPRKRARRTHLPRFGITHPGRVLAATKQRHLTYWRHSGTFKIPIFDMAFKLKNSKVDHTIELRLTFAGK